jgi:ATP-dependent RNA helicase DeaD
MLNFDALGLRPELLQAVTDLGFTSPTEVQSRVMEQLLPVHGQVDLVALAQTGTGKTAAFGLPLLEYFGKPTGRPQALILSPTRELCVQISVELEKYAAHLPAMR